MNILKVKYSYAVLYNCSISTQGTFNVVPLLIMAYSKWGFLTVFGSIEKYVQEHQPPIIIVIFLIVCLHVSFLGLCVCVCGYSTTFF